jgi:hypothetical protein
LHYLHNNVLVIDQSEYIEDRPVPGPFPAFPMTKREKAWERGWKLTSLSFSLRPSVLRHVMYTIVDRYYMTMKERLGASLGFHPPFFSPVTFSLGVLCPKVAARSPDLKEPG